MLDDDVTVPLTLSGCVEVSGRLDVTSRLDVAPGTTVVFRQDARLDIVDGGSIHAVGTASERIWMHGLRNVRGYWQGLCFSGSRESDLRFVVIQNAGKVSNPRSDVCRAAIGQISDEAEPVNITDSAIIGSATDGLDARDVQLGEFARNTFAGIEDYPVRASPANAAKLDHDSDYSGTSLNTGTGEAYANGKPFVYVSGTLTDGGIHILWPLGVPYLTGGNELHAHGSNIFLDHATTLILEAGVEHYFEGSGGINAFGNSVVAAVGTETEPVLLAGLEPIPGSWDGINLTDSHLELQWTTVRYGGADDTTKASIALGGVEPHLLALDHVHVLDSATCGLKTNEHTDRGFVNEDTLVFERNAVDEC